MAEPYQLYMEVSINPAQRNAFLQSEAGSAAAFDDWQPWLDSRGQRRLLLTRDELCELGQGTSAGFWISRWHAQSRAPMLDYYDAARERWYLAVLEFAERQDWVIGALNVLRRISDFKDPGTDYLLIYQYLFGGSQVVAAVALEPGHSQLLTQAPPAELINKANQQMDRLLRSMDVSRSALNELS